jgi:DNA-binding response OmpR family regulator
MGKILPAGGPTRSAIQSQTSPPPRILVVEADPDIRQLNADVLTNSGYHVDAAGDSVAAWQALNTDRYDLLITDSDMPLVTGLELIEKLRYDDMKLPIILMSATLPTEELARHPWLRIQATLSKPYTLAELLVTVKKVLNTPVGPCGSDAPPANWQKPPSAARLQC